MQQKDIENEVGVKPGFINYLFFEKCKNGLKIVRKIIVTLGVGTAELSSVGVAVISAGSSAAIEENSITYEKEIDEYNNEIQKYAEHIIV